MALSASVDPMLYDALRYMLNTTEYATLCRKAPQGLRKRAVSPQRFEEAVLSKDDYFPAAFRAAVRVFLATSAGLKLWDIVREGLLSKGKNRQPRPKVSLLKSPNFRLALSLSTILYLHRIFHRFFLRLRLRLLSEKAKSLRLRYPKISRLLTSYLTPAFGASLGGLALGIYPGDQLRLTMTIYVAARALEFLYNALEKDGWFSKQPEWMGAWLFFPLSCGQLLHAFVFDRDCFPTGFGDFIMKYTPNYIQKRPENAQSLGWPGTYEIVDSLAAMAKLNWPPFISPLLHPTHPTPLASSIPQSIHPITSRAHPSHTHLSCALLHPSSPSCLAAYISHLLLSFGPLVRFFTIVYTLFSLPRIRLLASSPARFLRPILSNAFTMATVAAGATGTSWASICLFQNMLPRKAVPQLRFALGGFLGGMFAVLDRKGGKANALYAARLSALSAWQVGKKRGAWRGTPGGDLAIVVLGLAILNGVIVRDRSRKENSVNSRVVRWAMEVLRGERELGMAAKV